VAQVRRLVESSGLAPGERLPSEAELVERLQVSRPVLREAIRQLETLGLVQVRRGRGMFVGDRDSLSGCLQLVRTAMAVTPRDLTQMAQLRTALECEAARRAAEDAGPEDVAELERLCDAMDRRGLPYEEAIGLDFAFHRRIFEAGSGELMRNVLVVLQGFIVEGMAQTTPQPRDRTVSRRLHRAILEAIRNQDPEAADAAMREHMRITCARLEASAASSSTGDVTATEGTDADRR
jgi:GntR family transcriptional repressor for pyruvate dehydrogenase complex